MTAQTPTQDPSPSRGARRFAGMLLVATGLLSLGLVMNHPSLGAHQGVQAAAVGIQAVARADRIVHGSLMAVFGLQALGFYIFSARLGFGRPAVPLGFLAFAAGAVVMIIPTTLDGFVTPDGAAACLKVAGGCAATDAGAFRLVAAMIQDFTKVALILLSVGTAGWGLALVSRGGWLSRLAGVVGLVCAVLPAWVLMTSEVYLRPGNLAEIIAAQVVWAVAAGALMLGGGRAHAL